VINSNLGPILHRFGDTVVCLLVEKSSKLAIYFIHPSLINRPRSGRPLSNFVMSQIFLETRMVKLSGGEKMTPAFFVLIQYRSVTHRRTDGHSFSGYTSACIACYANALVKTDNVGRYRVAKTVSDHFY